MNETGPANFYDGDDQANAKPVVASQEALAVVSTRYEATLAGGNFQSINDYVGSNTTTGELVRTPAGELRLQQVVTDTQGRVYTFYPDKISPIVVAAAMARLSRSEHDMRDLILKEFTAEEGKEEALLRRVVSQFGDDSVAQLLGGLPVVVEGASNLLTKQLEWGRLAAYLEQSTRYIYFDKKVAGRYRYYTPDYLPGSARDRYRYDMDRIFDNYSSVVRKMSEYFAAESEVPPRERDGAWRVAIRGKACDAARSLLPVATTSTVGIAGSATAIDNLIMHLRSRPLAEERETGDQILQEIRKTAGIFFERTDLPYRGNVISAHRADTRIATRALARSALQRLVEYDGQPVQLLEYTPEDELDLVAFMLYAHAGGHSHEAIKDQIATWSEEEKAAALELYIGERSNRRHRPGRALEHARYTFDLVSDYGIFRDLQRHRMVDALEWQDLSPQLGHETPEAIKAAGIEELYRETTEISRQMYDELLDTWGYQYEAQYATLLGDRMRWKLAYNAREAFHLHELRTQPAGHAGYRQLVNQMHSEVERVHPRLARAMIFVNRKDDDPSMGRLEQERRLQEKRRQLGLVS